jgi:autotransporter translocation and assembly factor TamB
VKRIELRDKQGVWLSLDDARVRWSFASLFSGRMRVEELRAAKIDVVRPPLPSEEKAASSSSSSFGISRRSRSTICMSARRWAASIRAGSSPARAC